MPTLPEDARTLMKVHVHVDRTDGTAYDLDTTAAAWHVGALSALFQARPDRVRALEHADVVREEIEHPSAALPQGLHRGAKLLHSYAERCRTARWEHLMPPRLSPAVLSTFAWWEGYRSVMPGVHSAVLRAARGEHVDSAVSVGFFALRASNVTPTVEAELAAEGFTAAEYVAFLLAHVGAEVAADLPAGEDARRANVLFGEARLLLEDGVLFTLEHSTTPRGTALRRWATPVP